VVTLCGRLTHQTGSSWRPWTRLPTFPGVFLGAYGANGGCTFTLKAEAWASAAPPTGGYNLDNGPYWTPQAAAYGGQELSPDQLLPDFVRDMSVCHHILRGFMSAFMMYNQWRLRTPGQWRLRAYQKRTCWTFWLSNVVAQVAKKMLSKVVRLVVLSAEAQVMS
jgi:hypothetical protein